MLILCDKCIRALRSRGEKIKVSGYDYAEYDNCDICDTPDYLSGVICVNDEIKFCEVGGGVDFGFTT